jgi:hypothetical protein
LNIHAGIRFGFIGAIVVILYGAIPLAQEYVEIEPPPDAGG